MRTTFGEEDLCNSEKSLSESPFPHASVWSYLLANHPDIHHTDRTMLRTSLLFGHQTPIVMCIPAQQRPGTDDPIPEQTP